MWELLTGQPLFLKDSDSLVMETIAKGEYPLASLIRKDIPPLIEEVLKKALQKSPSDRFKDCAEMEAALEEAGKKNGWKTFIPAFEYCTDNAAMIAITGYYKYLAGQFADLSVHSTARAAW